MRAFIILASLAVCANAGHLGYQYQQPHDAVSQGSYSSGGHGNVQTHGSSLGGFSGANIAGFTGSVSTPAVSHGSIIGSYSGPFSGPAISHGGSVSGPAVSHGSFNGGFSGSVGAGPANTGSYNGAYTGSVGAGPANHGSVVGHDNGASSEANYEKEFYSFAAPEHEFDDGHNTEDFTSSLKKNLRVIFIKGPENSGLEKAALQLAKSAADQQTAIYVLNKQADLSELANKLRNENTQSQSKPEVHFVKYRTPEEAEHAKHAIQAQYESLPGSTNSHDGGVAPVHNFVSSHQAPPSAPATSSNAYLPPHLRV